MTVIVTRAVCSGYTNCLATPNTAEAATKQRTVARQHPATHQSLAYALAGQHSHQHARSSAATTSTWPVCGNMSTGCTLRSRNATPALSLWHKSRRSRACPHNRWGKLRKCHPRDYHGYRRLSHCTAHCHVRGSKQRGLPHVRRRAPWRTPVTQGPAAACQASVRTPTLLQHSSQ